MKRCKDCKWWYFGLKRVSTGGSVRTLYYCDPLREHSTDNYDFDSMCCCNDMKADDCPHYRRKWWKFWIPKLLLLAAILLLAGCAESQKRQATKKPVEHIAETYIRPTTRTKPVAAKNRTARARRQMGRAKARRAWLRKTQMVHGRQ